MGLTLGASVPAFAHDGALPFHPHVQLGQTIKNVKTHLRYVSLTFDDLWYEYLAERIGRAYARRGISLTFFPIGRAVRNNLERPTAGYEDLYPRLRDMGHEFGCHLFTHENIHGLNLQQLKDQELEPAIKVLQQALGKDFYPVALRPPFGIITSELRQLCAFFDLPLVLWDVDTQDAVCTADGETELCEERMLGNMQRFLRPGSIILQHTIQVSFLAIQPTLDMLHNWNLKPVTLSSLLSLLDLDIHHRPIARLLP